MVVSHYRPVTLSQFSESPYWQQIPKDVREAIKVVGEVITFRVNEYVLSELIDWDTVPDDPIFRLLFPHRDMLSAQQYASLSSALERGERAEVSSVVGAIRADMNPHPAGQMSHNVPNIGGRPLPGLQHKYRETVLFFPSAGQVCHAYCTFCFRWPQFIGAPELRFQARETTDLTEFLRRETGVSDVLFTGGDPMIMGATVLSRYIDPLLADDLQHVQNIRIGTKAITYWPQRFVSDADADDILRLFERIVAAGKHLAIVTHINHPAEMSTQIAQEAIRRIASTGAVIRVQSPLVRHVNESSAVWAELLRQAVRHGMVPYYMFVERDTGPRFYFEVPLTRAVEIFRDAYRQVTGLARTLRGPTMSTFGGKVIVDGVVELAGSKYMLLHYLQARDPNWVNRPFLAQYDPKASWFDQLRPAQDADRDFFPHLASGESL